MHASHIITDITQQLRTSQLGKQHSHELHPYVKSLAIVTCLVLASNRIDKALFEFCWSVREIRANKKATL